MNDRSGEDKEKEKAGEAYVAIKIQHRPATKLENQCEMLHHMNALNPEDIYFARVFAYETKLAGVFSV